MNPRKMEGPDLRNINSNKCKKILHKEESEMRIQI